MGFACPPDGFPTFDFVALIGAENVSIIQRYNNQTGLFETLNIDSTDSPMGITFEILCGEGYLIRALSSIDGLEMP